MRRCGRSCAGLTGSSASDKDLSGNIPTPETTPHRGIETITYVLAGTVEHGEYSSNIVKNYRRFVIIFVSNKLCKRAGAYFLC